VWIGGIRSRYLYNISGTAKQDGMEVCSAGYEDCSCIDRSFKYFIHELV
jgi:hypothetical protein